MKSSDWLKTSTKLLLETFMTNGMFRSTSVFSCGKESGYWSASSSRQLSHLARAHANFRPILSPSLKDAVSILRINFYRISL